MLRVVGAIAAIMLVGACRWQQMKIRELETDLVILRTKHSSLSAAATNCDVQVTQCWAWRARMELELEQISKGLRK